MLTGPTLGNALREAMKRKRVTQGQVAEAFGIKQPSVSDWLKYGRIDKRHIPKLVAYFADVVGIEHWGLPASWSSTGQPSVVRELAPPPYVPHGDAADAALEARLLQAFRSVLRRDRLHAVEDLEHRAQELAEVAREITSGLGELQPSEPRMAQRRRRQR